MNNLNESQIVASDLDGTLLGSDKKIPPESARVLKRVQKAGKHVVLSTGRHYKDARTIAGLAGLKTHIISANGAQVYSSEGECLSEQFLPGSLVRKILDLAQQDSELDINIYAKERWYVARETDWLRRNAHLINLDYQMMDLAAPPEDNILKIYFTSAGRGESSLLSLEQELLARFASQVNVCFSSPQCLEVMAQSVSKLSGLVVLSRHLGLELSQCIAFGDGMNDVEMLEGVGRGLLMGSAAKRVKQALPGAVVIGTSEEQAVAGYLHRHVLSPLREENTC